MPGYRLCLTIGLVACCLSLLGADAACGTDVADLKEQLEDGLKARRPVEFKFIATVVTLVEQEKLPLALVKGTFTWARRKGIGSKHPFPYFERAMRIRAKRIGVVIQ